MKKLLTLLVIAFLFGVSVPGCAKSGLFFSWGDKVAFWKMDDYLDFQGDQVKPIKEATKKSFQLIRKNFLPEVAAQFKKTSLQIKAHYPQTEEEAAGFINSKEEDLRSLMRTFYETIRPQVQIAFQQLNASNWSSLKSELAVKNKKYLKEKDKCEDKTTEMFEFWIGSLEEAQRKKISEHCTHNSWSKDLQIKNREHVLEMFGKKAEINEGHFKAEAVFQTFEAWLKKPADFDLPEYSVQKTVHANNLKSLVQWFVLHSNDKQKQKFLENLDDKAAELEKISQKD